MLTKKLYEQATGRSQKSNIIAYQIRQSFRPGEITAEEANRIGYELASRFLKGKHAFIVATHTDREHIHNHIIYNSTTLDGTRKFRDFFFSGLAVQRLSDLICLEHQLSVIEKKPYRERQKRITYPPKESNRDRLCSVIDEILQQKPTDYEDFLQKLEQAHGRNALSGSRHWVPGTARMKSKQSLPEKPNTAHIRSNLPKSSRSSCWLTFKQNLPRAKVAATNAGRRSTT